MGLFNSIFGNMEKTKQENHLNWIPLTSLEQIEVIKEESKSQPIFIFKHSTRCGISRSVIRHFEKKFDESMQHLKVYYLDLLSYRNVSDEVGYTFQVMHQSPQVLVIKNETAVGKASHYDINALNLQEYL
jgi:bacillithiol system protein YtxJ